MLSSPSPSSCSSCSSCSSSCCSCSSYTSHAPPHAPHDPPHAPPHIPPHTPPHTPHGPPRGQCLPPWFSLQLYCGEPAVLCCHPPSFSPHSSSCSALLYSVLLLAPHHLPSIVRSRVLLSPHITHCSPRLPSQPLSAVVLLREAPPMPLPLTTLHHHPSQWLYCGE